MADKKQQLPVPGFRKGVSKDAILKAQAALAGGRQDPLTVPADANAWVDKKGVQHQGWMETVQITAAYRSVTKGGLLDMVLVGKIRQSKTKENTGKRVYSHNLVSQEAEMSEGHAFMSDLSWGKVTTFLTVAGLMPSSGELKPTFLEKVFPAQNSPSANSPLINKIMLVSIDQADEPKIDPKTKKPVLDSDGDEVLVKRDRMEQALPPVEEDEDDGDDDEDDEDSASADDSDDASDDEDEAGDDESDEDDDEDDEEEATPAPVTKPVVRKGKK